MAETNVGKITQIIGAVLDEVYGRTSSGDK